MLGELSTRTLGRFGAYRRRFFGLSDEDRAGRPARVVCVASGKGGTGKSIVSSNLACLRSQEGERVALVDFDAGLANAHLLLGLAPPHDLGDVLEGTVSAAEALVEGPAGVHVLSGGVGRDVLTNPTRRQLDRLFRALVPLESRFDLIVVDLGAGLGYPVLTHMAASQALVLVTGHEAPALSDGYALYKRAKRLNPALRIGMVLNRAPSQDAADRARARFADAAERFLGVSPEWLTWIPADQAVASSVERRLPVVLGEPTSPAARAIARVARWEAIDAAHGVSAFYDRAREALK